MRARLAAITIAALATLPAATPASAGPQFDRECSGKVDSRCHTQYCGIVSCVTYDCVVYAHPLGGYNSQTCVGKARPSDPVE